TVEMNKAARERPYSFGTDSRLLSIRYRNRGRRSTKAAVDGEENEFNPIVNAELVVDVRQVMLDGVFADPKRRRDIFIGLAVDERSDDLHFASGEAQSGDLHFGSAPTLDDNSAGLPFFTAGCLGRSPPNTATFTNDVDKIGDHCTTHPESTFEHGIN